MSQALIEQLEQGHSEAETHRLPHRDGPEFHNYSFGNILEIARQKPDATRVAGLYAWNQLGRKVKKGETRHPHSRSRDRHAGRKKDSRSREGHPHSESGRVGRIPFSLCLRCLQTEGKELPELSEQSDPADVGETATG
jgi:hypothetical protein